MNLVFKIRRDMLELIHKDLSRRHAFAWERVGFLACKAASLRDAGAAVIAFEYLPIADDHYEDDRAVGAMLGADAFRVALQFCYKNQSAMFHVHRHEHLGAPDFSHVDVSEARKYVPDFWKVQRTLPHGALVLSQDDMRALCWHPQLPKPRYFDEYVIVGVPTKRILEKR